MSRPVDFVEPDDESYEPDECMGKPYECQCQRCREWLIDVQADREYEERKEAA